MLKVLGEAHGERWALYHADCVDLLRQMPNETIDFGIWSPPFGICLSTVHLSLTWAIVHVTASSSHTMRFWLPK